MERPHILIVSGHPDLNHSIANATILDEVETAPARRGNPSSGLALSARQIQHQRRAGKPAEGRCDCLAVPFFPGMGCPG